MLSNSFNANQTVRTFSFISTGFSVGVKLPHAQLLPPHPSQSNDNGSLVQCPSFVPASKAAVGCCWLNSPYTIGTITALSMAESNKAQVILEILCDCECKQYIGLV